MAKFYRNTQSSKTYKTLTEASRELVVGQSVVEVERSLFGRETEVAVYVLRHTQWQKGDVSTSRTGQKKTGMGGSRR